MAAVLTATLGAGLAWFGYRRSSSLPPSAMAQDVVKPWGRLEYLPIAISPPEQYVDLERVDFPPPRWFFGPYTRQAILDLFRSSDLTPEHRVGLMQEHRWQQTPAGWWITPDPTLLLDLSPDARQQIYPVLAQFPENPQSVPYVVRRDVLEEQVRSGGLREQTVTMLRKVLYPRGRYYLLADVETLMEALADVAERRRIFYTVFQKQTMLVKLRVDAGSDVEALVNYWGKGKRAKSLRPLLESLRRVPGGCTIDLVHLLPAFARKRIYTFPTPDDPDRSKHDCHWSSLNFFNDPPEPAFDDHAKVRQAITSQYEPVSGEPTMGDLVVLRNESGRLVHSAIYLAEGLVFTKNGHALFQPWRYMTLSDMVEYYALFSPDEPLTVRFLRSRQPPVEKENAL